jgi:hypothetical protein
MVAAANLETLIPLKAPADAFCTIGAKSEKVIKFQLNNSELWAHWCRGSFVYVVISSSIRVPRSLALCVRLGRERIPPWMPPPLGISLRGPIRMSSGAKYQASSAQQNFSHVIIATIVNTILMLLINRWRQLAGAPCPEPCATIATARLLHLSHNLIPKSTAPKYPSFLGIEQLIAACNL